MGSGVVRVGTRGSALARIQANLVASALAQVDPDLRLELVPIATSGDRSQATNAPGADWGTGVFVKELEAALLREDIDIAVHSLKDMPPVLAAGLTLAAVPVRDDPLDVLVSPDGRGLEAFAPEARVGTSSARRVAFLRVARPDLQWLPVRGNVETRVRKLAEGQYDALVLAHAGLRRLELNVQYAPLDPELLPPAPGQGALGIQTRAGDRAIIELVEPLHDPATGAAIRAERRLMALLEGGCRLPVGALARPSAAGALHLIGGFASDDGSVTIERADGSLADPEGLAEHLAGMLRGAAPRARSRVLA